VSARGEIAVAWVQKYGRFGRAAGCICASGASAADWDRRACSLTWARSSIPASTDVAVAWGRGGELVTAYPRRRLVRRRTVRTVELRVGRPDGRLRRETLGPHVGIAEIEAASSPGAG